MKKPNFDHNKWSKLKNQDFSEVNINKLLHYKKIIVNMLCLYVYVISFSTSVRSNQALSLFVDQFAGCLNQGMVGTDSMSWLFNLGKVGPFLIYFPVDLLRISEGFEKKNVSKVWRIFLESILCDNSKQRCRFFKNPLDQNIITKSFWTIP